MQDEWTPYTAFPNHYPREQHLSSSGNYKFSKKNGLNSPLDILAIFKQNLQVGENSLLEASQFNINACDCTTLSCENLENKHDLRKYNNCFVERQQTRRLWNRIMENCHVEKRTHWRNSLENRYFLGSLEVLYKESPVMKDSSKWNFKCYGCHDERYKKREIWQSGRESDLLNDPDESEGEYTSPCCCPSYYHVSEHGVVFSSQDEVS